jgi:hypothetical protein
MLTDLAFVRLAATTGTHCHETEKLADAKQAEKRTQAAKYGDKWVAQEAKRKEKELIQDVQQFVGWAIQMGCSGSQEKGKGTYSRCTTIRRLGNILAAKKVGK